MTADKTMYLRQWLAWAGIGERALARRLRMPVSTVNSAIVRGSRPAWLVDAAQLLGVPPDALAVHPLDDGARPYRARALIYAAKRRLRDVERARRP